LQQLHPATKPKGKRLNLKCIRRNLEWTREKKASRFVSEAARCTEAPKALTVY
jgi:hypothetical protein